MKKKDKKIRKKKEHKLSEGLSRALLSEGVFARDWLSKEDEEAWKDLN